MNKTLKLIVIMLVLVMTLGTLAACGNDTPVPSGSQPVSPQPSDSKPSESEDPVDEPPAIEAIDRAEYNIPAKYTKVKTFFGTYGFGDAEIVAAMTDDESAFYFTWMAFDEEQIVEGTVTDGIVMVTYDLTGFMSGDAQLIYEDALASDEPWVPLTGEAAPQVEAVSRAEYNIPAKYTKVKTFFGTYGFGDAEIVAAMNDDESAFYFTWMAFDEEQIVEGTVTDGIVMVTYDLTGFMSGDAQLIYEDALASDEPWAPLQ
jgi:predicted small lipoprotein YifL